MADLQVPGALRWPALRALGGDGPIEALDHRRALRSRAPSSDTRWIAASPDFSPRAVDLDAKLGPLPSDAPPAPFALWRSLDKELLAAVRRRVAGRDDLAEHVVHWRRTGSVPAALAAFALLARAGRFDDPDPAASSETDDGPPALAPLEVDLPTEVRTGDLDRSVDAGIEALRRAVSRESLARFYGEVLAGERPAVLETSGAPLDGAALAVLLLPLPPELAEGLSLAGWIPSEEPTRRALAEGWHGVAAGPPEAAALATGRTLEAPLRDRGERLAEALLANDPARLETGAPAEGTAPAPASAERPIELAMWGTTSAGKTVFLAQLILAAAAENDPSGWTVWPTRELLDFSREMRDRLETENHFPPATPDNKMIDRVDYQFRRESDGLTATLSLEDRAGVQWQRLDDDVKERLESADGIVLLIDPERDTGRRDAQIRDTLDHLAATRGAVRDPRPLAICLSKADLLIETPDDLRMARESPDEFVRRHLDPALLATLDQYHDDYRLFPTSAIGVRLRWGVVEPAVFYDETLTLRIQPGARPIHLLAPFTWLLDRAAARRGEEAA